MNILNLLRLTRRSNAKEQKQQAIPTQCLVRKNQNGRCSKSKSLWLAAWIIHEITRQDLLVFARRNNIKDAAEIIEGFSETASRWPLIAQECEVPQKMIEAIIPEMKLSI